MFEPFQLCTDLPQQVYKSAMKCDEEIRNNLYDNIILCGGNAKFRGIADRMKKEVQLLSPYTENINVTVPAIEEKFSVWKGGSILASMSTFKQMCITLEEYDEFGPAIVHRKCF